MANEKIHVQSKHTPAMIRAEVDSMLGFSALRLCLGHVMMLAEARSPYVFGGDVTPLDTELAKKIMRSELPDYEFHTALIGEMDTAFRPFEILENDDKPGDPKAKKSDVKPFSPEWMADMLRAAAQAVPSLDIEAALWKIPLVMLIHLWLAEARANGSVTRRPPDVKAALAEWRKLMKKESDK